MHFQEKNELEELLGIAKSHLADNLPFVLYRLPKNHVVKGIFQNNATTSIGSSFSGSGFVFAPFSTNGRTLWLRPDTCICATQHQNTAPKISKEALEVDGKAHRALVKKAVGAIKNGAFTKVVLSKPFTLALEIAPTLLFSKALALYPEAFCYLWFHPLTGIWLGASPELLAKTSNGYFYTTALAGTVAQTDKNRPNWTKKEFEEQELVTTYLKAALAKYLSEIEVTPLKSILAGKLWHLKTDISGRMENWDSLEAIIGAIHPTSAVCGLPKREAMAFILENEGYDRAYYTGYLGEILGEHGEASIFVNLRCLHIAQGKVSIYVGGGITKDSDPQKEWDELLHKSGTMLALL